MIFLLFQFSSQSSPEYLCSIDLCKSRTNRNAEREKKDREESVEGFVKYCPKQVCISCVKKSLNLPHKHNVKWAN